MKTYEEVAPSGVRVESTVPFVEPRWWDNPVLHFAWSYTSWVTLILKVRGYPGPRRWFDSWGKR